MKKIKSLYNLGRDKTRPVFYRAFSFGEILCIILSLLTILILICLIGCRLAGCKVPDCINPLMALLCAGAVGYFTNFIAIKMLFEPYRKEDFHWLKFVTGGFWKQGLIPANKNSIGEKMASEITTKLLTPESISNEVCKMVSSKFSDPVIIGRLRCEIQSIILENKKKIIDVAMPQIQKSFIEIVNKAVSAKNVKDFWENVVERWLNEEQNRRKISVTIVSAFREKSPKLTRMARDFIREKINEWPMCNSINNTVRFVSPYFDLSKELTNVINWREIEKSLSEKIGEKKTLLLVETEIRKNAEKLREWIDNPSSQKELFTYLDAVKSYLERFLEDYLSQKIPEFIDELSTSKELWEWLENSAIPAFKKRLQTWLESDGKKMILDSLDIENRIVSAVEKQDVREFQDMIDKIASEHLGAIQVLGYILGLAAGLLLLFAQN